MPSHNRQPLTRRLGLGFLWICLWALWACQSHAPARPDAAHVTWTSYVHEPLGLRLELPDAYGKKYQGDEVAFTYNGTVARLVWVTDEEAQHRGLWPRASAGVPVKMGGRDGYRYVYDHPDGPVLSHTISYVVPYRGRLLGLEFRTDADTLGTLDARMLSSLTFDVR